MGTKIRVLYCLQSGDMNVNNLIYILIFRYGAVIEQITSI